MNNLHERIVAAFDMVHVEKSIQASALEYVHSRHAMESRHRNGTVRKLAAAICMLVLVISGIFTAVYRIPVTVVSVDINPSIELTVNHFDRVIHVESYNEDGQILLETVSLKNKRSLDAVEAILETGMIRNLMHENEKLVLTVVGDSDAEAARLQAKLEESLDSVKNTQCLSASVDKVKDAHSCGLSYGKYLACKDVLEENADLTLEDLQDMTMREIHALSGHHSKEHHKVEPAETVPPGTTQATEPAVQKESTHHTQSGGMHHGKKHSH